MAAAAQKKTRKGSPATASPRVVSVAGEPTGRFAQVLLETREAGLSIEPFEITEDLVLQPPSRARVKAMEQASAAYLLAQTSAVALVGSQGAAPTDDDERAVWAKKRQEELSNAYALADEAEQAFNEALFGDADVYQRVCEFFEDRPGWQRQAFENAVNQQFRRLPKDGTCQACGQVVDENAGESEGESSGSSSTSGTSSTVTSPQNSTEPTPATGSAVSDPGPSSSSTPSV